MFVNTLLLFGGKSMMRFMMTDWLGLQFMRMLFALATPGYKGANILGSIGLNPGPGL